MVEYGQLIIGPPGSGKTTYCEGMKQLMNALRRPVITVNLDFANDWAAKIDFARQNKDSIAEFSAPDVDVRKLMTIQDVMEEQHLGPNGAIIYANKILADNVKWLLSEIIAAKDKNGYTHAYVLLDMPGQVELYTIDDSLKRIVRALNNGDRGIRFVAVHLVDSTLCIQLHHYLSATLISLVAQIGLELPFLNVFTKVDLLKEDELEKQKLSLEYLARAEDLEYLLPIAHPGAVSNAKCAAKERKFAQFHQAIVELVEDFSLVGYLPLDIQDKERALAVLSAADRANGFSMSEYVQKHVS